MAEPTPQPQPQTLPSTQLSLPAALDTVQIQDLPATAFYISNFITEEEERQILQRVSGSVTQR